MAYWTTVARLREGDFVIYNHQIAVIKNIAKGDKPKSRVLWIRWRDLHGELTNTIVTHGLTKKFMVTETAKCLDCNIDLDRLEVFPAGRCVECHAKVATPPGLDQFIRMWRGE